MTATSDIATEFQTRRHGVRAGVKDYLDGKVYGSAFAGLSNDEFGEVTEQWLGGYLYGFCLYR